jgi:hypothetical protein
MTVTEAKNRLLKTYPNLDIKEVRDYKGLYVFTALDPDDKGFMKMDLQLDPFYSVDKQTGELLNFLPAANNPGEFFNTKTLPL